MNREFVVLFGALIVLLCCTCAQKGLLNLMIWDMCLFTEG